jgi:glycosyltransferase involved in cell wall biosynthesis
MCCSFTKRKRPNDLINAVKKLDTSNNIFLLFIGDGPERSKIELNLKNTGIRYYITGFLGQNEISKYYIVSDVSLVLSDYDPSPKALNEAMNFSNCVITTKNVGTSDDLIKHNINGYIINAGDIDVLAKIINQLNKNREIIQTMGRESLKIVSEFNYIKDAESIAEAILEITK